jgi:hypothetical protein
MKKFLLVFLIGINLIIINSCAKPTVVNIMQPGDKNLNCKELNEQIEESKKLKKDAELVKGETGENAARIMLFWPAWARTLHNADVAIVAAEDRIFYLNKLARNKKCKSSDSIDVSSQLKNLNELYKSGALTKEEFEKAKKRLLN